MDDGTGARPARYLDAAEFSSLMARFAPFERQPRLAVACSGGADSMALTLLADHWARGEGGAVTALIVDHGLRPDSANEANETASRLKSRGIAHQILKREGEVPAGDIEAFARDARYRLFEQWCGENGVLHLLVAHHRDDQAETFLLRLARGSGLDGLAGMAPESARRNFRLLRPLLGVPRDRLKATLEQAGLDFAEDPMNSDPAYARVRLRAARDTLAAEGLTPERLTATAAHLARARAALERFDRVSRHGPKQFSWFIYRVSHPVMREMFLDPRNVLRMEEALLSLLAGDIFGRTPIWGRLRLFKALYYALAFATLGRSWRAARLRAANIRAEAE